MMKKLPLGLVLMWLCVSFGYAAPAPTLEILPGGVSPDGKLAVAMVRLQPGERPDKPEAFFIYLVRNPGGEMVRKIEWSAHSRYANLPFVSQQDEVCAWSPDGRHVAIDKHSVCILASVSESAFAQVVLPEESTHPKGEILKVLRPVQSPKPSHGESFGEWVSATSFVTCRYGLEVAASPADHTGEVSLSAWGLSTPITSGDLASGVVGEPNPRRYSQAAFTVQGYSVGPGAGLDLTKYGFQRFDGRIEKVYELRDFQWVLTDLRPRHSSSLVILPGGISPDGTLAIAVPLPAPLERVERADPAVYLVRYPSREIVQKILRLKDPLDTSDRLRIGRSDPCSWSPDGRHVAINKRSRFVVLRASGVVLSQIDLPDESTHPKGGIFQGLRPVGEDIGKVPATPLHGERFEAWLSPTSFVAYEYGLEAATNAADRAGQVSLSKWGMNRPITAGDLALGVIGAPKSRTPTEAVIAGGKPFGLAQGAGPDLAENGFPNFTGRIEKVYELRDSQWVLTDLRTPAGKPGNHAPEE